MLDWKKNRYILYTIFNMLTPFDHKNILAVCSTWRTILLNFLQTQPTYLDYIFDTKLNILSFTTRDLKTVEKFSFMYTCYSTILSPVNWSYYQNIPTIKWVRSNFSNSFYSFDDNFHMDKRQSVKIDRYHKSIPLQDFLYLLKKSNIGKRICSKMGENVDIMKYIDIDVQTDIPCGHYTCDGNDFSIEFITILGSNGKKYIYRRRGGCEIRGSTFSVNKGSTIKDLPLEMDVSLTEKDLFKVYT